MSSRSLSLVLLVILAMVAPAASAAHLIVNGQGITLEHGLIPSAEGFLAPLVELARYLGAEVAQDDHGFLLRWGAGEETRLSSEGLVTRAGIAYIPLGELAKLLGAKLLVFGDSLYLFAPQGELLSLTYSPDEGVVRLRLSRLAPLEVAHGRGEVKLLFHNAVLRIAPRTGRFSRGPVERLALRAEEPGKVVLQLKLRGAASYRLSKNSVAGGYLVELEFEPADPQAHRFASPRASTEVQLTPWISYHREEQRTATGQVVIEYLLIEDYQVHYRLRAALPREGLARLDELVWALGGVAGINANFFDPETERPIGLLIADGQVLSPPYGQRAALGIDLFGRAVVFRQDALPFLPLRDAVGAGPLLLTGGQVVLDHQDEGFSPDFVKRRAARSAIGLTPQGDLILLVVRKDGSSAGMTMEELAGLLQGLGAAEALALDGGSSASLVVRRGLSLYSTGNRRIAVGLVLVPR